MSWEVDPWLRVRSALLQGWGIRTGLQRFLVRERKTGEPWATRELRVTEHQAKRCCSDRHRPCCNKSQLSTTRVSPERGRAVGKQGLATHRVLGKHLLTLSQMGFTSSPSSGSKIFSPDIIGVRFM